MQFRQVISPLYQNSSVLLPGIVYLSLLGFCASLHLSDSQQELEQVIFIAKNAPHNHEIYFQFKGNRSKKLNCVG